jgi:hypothetical protein
MTEADLMTRIASWRNLGPLREPPDLEREMAATAEAMSDADADTVAAVVVLLDREGDPDTLGALLQFLEHYSPLHRHALGAALLARLGPDGPPALVEQIGATDHPDAVKRLRECMDLAGASEELLIALASTLGELRGDDASALLDELASQDPLPAAVRDEIKIARRLRASER